MTQQLIEGAEYLAGLGAFFWVARWAMFAVMDRVNGMDGIGPMRRRRYRR